MIKISKVFVFMVLSVLVLNVQTEALAPSPLLRYPSLNPDGTRIAFCFQGDIWTVPVSGGEARRITVHDGYDAAPLWSVDGRQIAFSSNRYGNNDLYIIPAGGGIPRRMTYHSSGDRLSQWTPDNTLLFTSARLYKQVEWSSELFSVPVSGGTPGLVLDALGDDPAMSPDQRFIAFVRGNCRVTRESYRGPANRNIWLYDTKLKKYSLLTTDKGNDHQPRWSDERTLYFLSAQTGRYNVHSVELDDTGKVTETDQVTQFKDFGVRYFNLSADGRTMVLERADSIYTLSAADKKPVKVHVHIGADYRSDPVEHKTYSSRAGDYDVSPDGKLTAFVVRGEVFVRENKKEKTRTVNLTRHPYRDSNPAWLNDNALIFVSDREGQQDLYLVQSSDPKQHDLLRTLKRKTLRLTGNKAEEHHPVISPDGKKIAFIRGRGQLVTADISGQGKLSNEKILLDGWDTPGDVCWSPDSKWLAYSLSDLDFNSEIFIHAADNSKTPVNISMHPREDYSPVWSLDGSKLGFTSNRNYGNHDVWFVWLKKKDWEKTRQDWEETEDKPAKKGQKAKKDEIKGKNSKAAKEEQEKTAPMVIDFEDIHERLVQVTALPGDEGSLAISKDGKTFYFSAADPAAKGRDLYSIKWDGTKAKAVTKGGQDPYDVTLDKSGSYLYLLKSRGQLARIDTKSNKMESLSFSAKMDIHHLEEKKQIFAEAVRTLTDGFYDPGFHGRDWNKLVQTYRPIALKASTRQDFRDMFNVMLGQLDASHMGMRTRRGAGISNLQNEKTGLLGIRLEPMSKGVRVTHVVPGSPADRQNSKLNKGDIIMSVDGTHIDNTMNFYALLTGKENEKILLEVKNSTGTVREVVIRPTGSLRSELYDEWVKDRRRLTDLYSNGRLGYLHIRAMGWSSFERFEREITASGYGKEGIVIDVRFNGGGWTTDYLMTVLNVKQHAYTIPRGAAANLEQEHHKFKNHYPFGERLPYAVWTKPSVALCNANSYSNAEIFSHAYKTLGIGKLVGIPTFGAVISTGGRGLLDGSYVRLPFRAWYVKATAENMEHGPAVPHIIIDNPPDAKAKGTDPQLKRAVEELLKEIDQKK
jgi:Tol biopolymer transport system component